MKYLKFIFPLLFILFSCSSISPEDSEIIDDFIIGNWKYSTYQEDYKSESVVDNEVMLKIFKDNEFRYAETREKKEPSKLDKYKSTCEELGFVSGTEKFGDCVMKLMDKD